MKKARWPFLPLIYFLLLGGLSCSHEKEEALVGDPGDFIAAMRNAGLGVKEGLMKNVNIIYDCCDVSKPLPMCYGNNPGAPYMATYLPEADGQLIRNMPLNYLDFAACPNGQPCPDKMSRSYRFGENEAMVIVGRTPPAATIYFSYIFYLTLRYSGDNASPPYHRLFASMSDALNNQTIWTEGTPCGRAGDSFDKETMIVITADRGLDRSIRQAAEAAGYSEKIINSVVIPTQLVHLGIEYKKDEMALLHRCANWDDAYINNPPVRAFRVSSASPADPFPAPAFTPRGSGTTEFQFAAAVAMLRQKLLERYGPGKAIQEYQSTKMVPEGVECISRDIDCLADNHDAVYLRIPEGGDTPVSRGVTFALGEDADDFIIVYGVNHTASGKTLYHSLATYRHALLNGLTTIWDKEFAGSADEFLKDTPYASQAKYLYAVRIARSCPAAADIPEACLDFPNEFGLPPNAKDECKTAGKDDLFIVIRAYLERATGVGPSYEEVIWDKAIHFKK